MNFTNPIYLNNNKIFLGNNLDINDPYLNVIPTISSATIKNLLEDVIANNIDVQIKASANGKPLLNFLKEELTFIEAGGGLVQNTAGAYLCIYRNDKWDLPKGKLEKGETIGQCALREVEEETGATDLVLGEFITSTYHLYKMKGNFVLKQTYWYNMHCPIQPLVAQAEEGITKVEWIAKENLKSVMENTFRNILIVLEFIQ